ncbi:MAG: DUF1573 domain-containing protein [Pirellulales bacterium]
MLRKWIAALLVATVAIGATSYIQERPQPGQPRFVRVPVQRNIVRDAPTALQDALPLSASLRLSHDLGVVAPYTTHTCRFSIPNRTNSLWTFKQVDVTCTCTVPRISGTAIEPGGHGYVDVRYRAPSKEFDDQRLLHVHFAERGAPAISLQVRAKVRELISFSSPAILFGAIGSNANAQAHFDILNYSVTPWSSVRVLPTAEWLTCDIRPELSLNPSAGPGGPRQAWRVIVNVRTKDLDIGPHQGHIDVAVQTSNGPLVRRQKAILEVYPPVTVVPSQLFFGQIAARESVARKLLLRFIARELPDTVRHIHIRHDVGDELTVTTERISNTMHQVVAELAPETGRSRSLRGAVYISFGNGFPELKVPVTATVEGAAE